MAGYMTVQYGNIYEGQLPNGHTDSVYNGQIVSYDVTSNSLKPIADTNIEILCRQAVTLFDGVPGYEFVVNKIPAGKMFYLVENMCPIDNTQEYDTAEVAVKPGELLRAHPLLPGDQFVASTPNTVATGTMYGVDANGNVG